MRSIASFQDTVGEKKATKSAAAASAQIQAVRLLGRWTRVARGHLALGAGCSCGGAFGNVPMQDFEQHILDFLHSRHGASAAALLRERAGYVEGEAGSLAGLLRAIATRTAEAPMSVQSALLDDLERTIASFEELHPNAPSAFGQ